MPDGPSGSVVLDTNVYVSALFWLGNPHRIIELALDRKIVVYTSPGILAELETVLTREFLEDRDFVEQQISLILEFAKVVEPVRRVRVVIEDPDDDKIVECAIAARASHIVTGDPHLLVLKEVFGIKVVSPSEFLGLF